MEQPEYHMFHRERVEKEYVPLYREFGLGTPTWSPLASGFLTGKYRRDRVPVSARAARIRDRYFNDRGFALLEALDGVAAARGLTPAQAALAWLLTQPVVTAPIIGANTVEQLRESLGAVGARLAPEEMAVLDQVSAWE
jgi:aryl-alcohol dehydrogenase-like predicted oxidoreductase